MTVDNTLRVGLQSVVQVITLRAVEEVPSARTVLGREIKRAYAQSGLTYQDLADQLKVSKQAVYRYAQGDVPLDRLDAIARATGQHLVFRIGEDEREGWPEWARVLEEKINHLSDAALAGDLREARRTASAPDADEDPPSGQGNPAGGRGLQRGR